MFRKSVVLMFLVAALTISFSALPMAQADQVGGVTVTVNGQAVSFPDQQPYIDSSTGRVFVPLRFVSQAMGCTVYWQWHVLNDVTVTTPTTDIEMLIGSTQPTVNGQVYTIDAPATISNGRTMVPLRFISEGLGATVNWDAGSKTVSIIDTYLTASTYTINGYVIPKSTQMGISDSASNPVQLGPDVDIQVVLHMDTDTFTAVTEPISQQVTELQGILSQQLDQAAIQQIMAVVNQKIAAGANSPDVEKFFKLDGKSEGVRSDRGDIYVAVGTW